jgi:hypothetical protein
MYVYSMAKINRPISQSPRDYQVLEKFKDSNPGIEISNLMTACTLKFIYEYTNSPSSLFISGYDLYMNDINKKKLEVNLK